MTNYEYYKKQIERITRLGLRFGFDTTTGEIAYCNRINCADCKFIGGCAYKKIEWADEEYEESAVDWSQVPIDTKVLISNDGENWSKRYFAKVSDKGDPFVWYDGLSSWTAPQGWYGKYKYVKLAEEEQNASYQTRATEKTAR